MLLEASVESKCDEKERSVAAGRIVALNAFDGNGGDEEREFAEQPPDGDANWEVCAPEKNELIGKGATERDGSSNKRRRRACGGRRGELKRKRPVQDNVCPRACLWEPPVSPYGLIEELLYWDPWKLLIACILLNKTSGVQVRSIIWEFFRNYPTPESLLEEKDVSKIFNLIKPLGLGSKRSETMKRFSDEYLHQEWINPITLHGIGQYASDAYFIFCRGQWRDVDPEDKELRRYVEWLELSDGVGYAGTRDCIPIPREV